MKITFAEQSHIDRLAYIVRTTFHLACPKDSKRDLQSVYISKHLCAQSFKQLLSSEHYHIWVALEANQPIGFAVMQGMSDELAMLSKLYVLPDYQGKGVALSLYNAVVNHTKISGYTKLNLSVFSGNSKAKAFYEKQGFKLVGDHDFLMETELHKDHIYQLEV
jgi:ribosomal protein S18 acetylase RimI-like enzyme